MTVKKFCQHCGALVFTGREEEFKDGLEVFGEFVNGGECDGCGGYFCAECLGSGLCRDCREDAPDEDEYFPF